ncbi:MAG: rhomboid family intramembrane serine protease [Gemmatimonadetes bacterium]|nr:rhomboid family intramembrane serine protease [Gemmatimonadota bacterium]
MTAPGPPPHLPDALVERDRHELERSVLRSSIVTWVVVTLGVATWWWRKDGLDTRSLSFLVLGLTTFQVGAKAWELYKHVRRGPVAPETAEHPLPGSVTPLGTPVVRAAVLGMPLETFLLVACIAVVFVFELLVPEPQLMLAALDPGRVRAGEWWRVLTSAYVHAGPLHLWMNLAATRAIAPLVELLGPPSRLPLVFLVSALAASGASLVLYPHTPSVGASGGIMGVVGYLLVLSWRRPRIMSRRLQSALLASLGLTAYIGIFGFQFINNAAHGGGLAGGALVALLDVRADAVARPSAHARTLSALGHLSRILLVASAAIAVIVMTSHRP